MASMTSSEQTTKEDGDEEGRGGGGGGGGGIRWADMGSAAVSRGWRLTKKAALAGVAITSFPVVIPPYCVFSTIGLALAAPFAVYLASVAATEKLMRSLLPRPRAFFREEEDDEDEKEGYEEPVDVELEEEKPVDDHKEEDEAASDALVEAEVETSILSSECSTVGVEERNGFAEPRPAMTKEEEEEGRQYDENLYKKQNIREEISALRVIMGYKGALQTSTVEELRDLYLFTGVEPPVSLKSSSDHVDIDEKLQFLKLLVGVK